MANKKERTHGGKEKKKRNSKQKTTTLLSEKKEEAGNVSEQRVKGWIHVIRVSTRYNPTEPTATRTAGQKTLTNKDRMSGLVKHRDHHPSLVHRK